MVIKKVILLALLSICSFFTATAQVSDRAIERGINTSGIIGQTDLSDSRLSGLIQPFIRYELSSRMDGEFSIGLGILKSRDYQTRLLPINFSVNFFPFEKVYSTEQSFIQLSDFFLHAGIGALNFSHIRIPRPDDPLTVEAGRTIPNSTFWSFGNNWTLQLPIGVGLQLQLDEKVNINFKTGYTFTGSKEIDALSGSNRDGYWSFSFGLSFGGREKAKRENPVRTQAPQTVTFERKKVKGKPGSVDEEFSDFEIYLLMKSIPVVEYDAEELSDSDLGEVTFEDDINHDSNNTVDISKESDRISDLEIYLLMKSIPVVEYDAEELSDSE